MSYTVYDFSESIDRVPLPRDQIARVVAAWGEQGDFAEWEGGFLCELRDGSAIYIWGWCDTTGWGCQDGIEVQRFETVPECEAIKPVCDVIGIDWKPGDDKWLDAVKDWDVEPADLNRYVRGEIEAWP